MSEIPEFIDQTPPPGGEMSAIDTWIAAITKPQESTFAEIAAQTSASFGKAFLWAFLSFLITFFTALITQTFSFGGHMKSLRQFLPPEIAREIPKNLVGGGGAGIHLGTVICGAPVGAIFSVIFFVIGVAIIQWSAQLFGGTGSVEKLAYTFAAILVPYSVVSGVLSLFIAIPVVGILFSLLGVGLSIYLFILEVMAVKAVNNIGTLQAVGALILPGLVIFLFFCCCVVLGLMLLGPQIGNVFSGIQQGLY